MIPPRGIPSSPARLRLAALLFCLLAPTVARAQDDRIREQRQELERIRRERSELERQMQALQTTVHELADEVALLDRRAEATARLVAALDEQLVSISTEIDVASANMTRAEAELVEKRATLRRRLIDIYKRGPLYTAQAMLSAASFGELVARYKYLHLIALRDRALVNQVEALRNQIQRDRDRLVGLRRSLAQNREERKIEEERLRVLEQQQRQQLARTRRTQQETQARLADIRRAESQLASTIAALEEERRRADAAAARSGAARATSAIRVADHGRLDWPVTGALVYTFGRAVQANNTAIRWNGIGIRANEGTEVRSIAAGRVARVGTLGTYGLTVIIEHGGGDYSIYGKLARAAVRPGDAIAKGDLVGTVGVADPDLPPHLHFEIRHGERAAAIDPLTWLKRNP